MAKKPYQDTRLAKFLETRILELKFKKSQAEIAEEAGFVNPNMVTMIKQGATKLPLDRVPALAKALECAPSLLLRLALERSEGSTAAAAIYEIIGQPIGPVAVWCRSFHSILCIKGDELWDKHGRTNFARMQCA